ncbi:hypothetical protein B0T26DRAFT_751538 [Lasiosphaeria miniovina]|uniref:Uncharacterized protein n=1 Tax=Lasiosphaeria miniovina TaxID=1954250 RepID=A0AA40DXP8_9PEZI|nr:uncharacterized protein B0T26DRAFT_751538 [Lasiosphaeria miniovina]KAK0717487.1 hypothetical protein B0T26DRAFT_751538 [Lasiosphaeria miniovina]
MRPLNHVRRDDLSDFRRGVDRAPLNKRGWECCLRSVSELCPKGYVYEHSAEYHGDYLPPRGAL